MTVASDGSVNHRNWYYAVGSRESWNGGIPAASWAVRVVELYVLPPQDVLHRAAEMKHKQTSAAEGPPSHLNMTAEEPTTHQYDTVAFVIGLLVICGCGAGVICFVAAVRRGGVRCPCFRIQTGAAKVPKVSHFVSPSNYSSNSLVRCADSRISKLTSAMPCIFMHAE